MTIQLLTFVAGVGSVGWLARSTGGSQRKPPRADGLEKPHHIQALNYGSAEGESSAIISKMANQVIPAALMSGAAGAVDQPGKTQAMVLHRTPLLLYGILKTPSH